MNRRVTASVLWIGVAAILLVGCASESDQQRRDREEKMRQDAANATEKAKPAIEAAGKEINKIADRAAEDARAAAQGVKEGWSGTKEPQINVNTAGEGDLVTLPGIGKHDALAIIKGRPYQDKHDLVRRNILTEETFDKISDRLTVD
jgi:DNA uptake protein ComE-like DNA-binding protein